MKKSFTTTIDKDIQEEFKNACKKNKVTMSEILEVFMSEYANDDYILETKRVLKRVK